MRNTSLIKKIICHIQKWPIYCPLCGNISYIFAINQDNLRESCLCHKCNSTNRQRQIAYSLCKKIKINSLNKIKDYQGSIYNTESFGPVHDQLLKAKNYTYSEYFGNRYKSGARH
ncbi:hypothetical protein KJ909_02935, partial [Patescibacteria group bacterium]|nr:hypothetical protein [Patescibacteria group bacterium]